MASEDYPYPMLRNFLSQTEKNTHHFRSNFIAKSSLLQALRYLEQQKEVHLAVPFPDTRMWHGDRESRWSDFSKVQPYNGDLTVREL